MAKFSERYGYTKVSDVIIREDMPLKVSNGLYNILKDFHSCSIEEYIYTEYFNRRLDSFNINIYYSLNHIIDEGVEWFKRLDMLEYLLPLICSNFDKFYSKDSADSMRQKLVDDINHLFERHNYAYRIIDGKIVEVTTLQEIEAIEDALQNPLDGVRTHLKTALDRMSPTQESPDYRNSIKESISAVEVWCRNATGEATLGAALRKLEINGVIIPVLLKNVFIKLYVYTNDDQTGIRHALMDDEYVPTADEAIFMLVSCSAFINYLTKKSQEV